MSHSISLTAKVSGTSEASGSDKLSTFAGGQSSTSSDVAKSSSSTLTSNLDNSEDPSASAYDDYTADEDVSNYDGENEAISSETQYEGTPAAWGKSCLQ